MSVLRRTLSSIKQTHLSFIWIPSVGPSPPQNQMSALPCISFIMQSAVNKAHFSGGAQREPLQSKLVFPQRQPGGEKKVQLWDSLRSCSAQDKREIQTEMIFINIFFFKKGLKLLVMELGRHFKKAEVKKMRFHMDHYATIILPNPLQRRMTVFDWHGP